MDYVHLSTARHFCYELRPAENFQQQFGTREVCRASQDRYIYFVYPARVPYFVLAQLDSRLSCLRGASKRL